MKQSINILSKRIDVLHKEIDRIEKELEDPEMNADYEFYKNDLANMEMEILQHQKAIKILDESV